MFTQDSPNADNATQAQINRFQRDDQKVGPYIVLNLAKEPATLITSVRMSDDTTKKIWEKLTDTYQKENIQSKINLRGKLHSLRYRDVPNLQNHLTPIEEIFVELSK